VRFQPLASRIALTALAFLLSAIPASGDERAPAAEKAPESATSTADTPAEEPSQQLPHIVSIRFVGNEHFSSRSLKRELET
jgi:hypothetical protein